MPGVKVVEQPSFEVRMLPINVTQPPLDDPRVRKAISLAFDYQAMVDFFSGFGVVPQGPLPSGLLPEGYDAQPMQQDLDRAKELLAEAGYPDGGFSVTFLGLKGLSYEEFAGNVLQEQLAELGITVEQQLAPWPQMVEIQSNPDTAAGVSFLNNSAFTDDPTQLLRSSYSSANHADPAATTGRTTPTPTSTGSSTRPAPRSRRRHARPADDRTARHASTSRLPRGVRGRTHPRPAGA